MSWQAAFDAAVLEPLRSDPDSVHLWRRSRSEGTKVLQEAARRGQLGQDGDRRQALWGTFRYQRYHADAMVAALARYDTREDRVCLDLGCGAATVAVALHEVTRFRDASSRTLSYIGVDHNRHSREIARALLGHHHYSDIQPAHVTADLGEAVTHAADALAEGGRPVVTMSYLLHQDAVDDIAVEHFAADIVRLVGAVHPRPVPVVITDRLSNEHPRQDRLVTRLAESVRIEGATRWKSLAVPRRFPNLYPDEEGWFRHLPATPTVHSWILKLRAR